MKSRNKSTYNNNISGDITCDVFFTPPIYHSLIGLERFVDDIKKEKRELCDISLEISSIFSSSFEETAYSIRYFL